MHTLASEQDNNINNNKQSTTQQTTLQQAEMTFLTGIANSIFPAAEYTIGKEVLSPSTSNPNTLVTYPTSMRLVAPGSVAFQEGSRNIGFVADKTAWIVNAVEGDHHRPDLSASEVRPSVASAREARDDGKVVEFMQHTISTTPDPSSHTPKTNTKTTTTFTSTTSSIFLHHSSVDPPSPHPNPVSQHHIQKRNWTAPTVLDIHRDATAAPVDGRVMQGSQRQHWDPYAISPMELLIALAF
ncbi:hypothetical protein BC829DRAFT_491014 [Chytridium lagenaria]|nr:hypothetical protein BC829DRAFT_491014 [Chytridium lagenaria]